LLLLLLLLLPLRLVHVGRRGSPKIVTSHTPVISQWQFFGCAPRMSGAWRCAGTSNSSSSSSSSDGCCKTLDTGKH
jgi:hypothetical protein